MKLNQAVFPYKEILNEWDEMFHTAEQAMRHTGYGKSHVWSVVEDEDLIEDGKRYSIQTYGPSRHFVNRLGYVVTVEEHDDETYYTEFLGPFEGDDDG